MNWGRAKTILIILFLLINLFLMVVLSQTKTNYNTIGESTIENTVTVLNRYGIDIAKADIPNQRHKNQNINIVNVLPDVENLAKTLLGAGYSVVKKDNEGNEFVYKKEEKSLTVREDSFLYIHNKDIQPISNPNLGDVRGDVLVKFQRLINRDGELYVAEEKIENNLYHGTVGAKHDGINIKGIHLRLTADREDIIKMEGNWFAEQEPETISKERLKDVTSVLVGMLYMEDVKMTGIEKVEFAYYVPEEYVNNKIVSAIPVYAVTDQSHKEYIFYARTGELIYH